MSTPLHKHFGSPPELSPFEGGDNRTTVIKPASARKMMSVVGDVLPDDFIASYTASSPISSSSSLPSWSGVRCGRSRKCVSSKAALLILLWTFVVVFLSGMLKPDLILTTHVIPDKIFILFVYGNAVVVTCFFPLAGFCADTRCGRYKTVVTSLFILVPVAPLLGVGLLIFIMIMTDYNFILWLLLGVTILGSVGLVGFSANVVQFGMDQLHDSPGEDRTLFIHWYVWTYNASLLANRLAWNLAVTVPYNTTSRTYYNIIGYCLLESIFLSVSVVLPITLCLARRRRRWFLIEPGQYNPYKLVYGITKFARQHKTPVLRSAFTYCEDEVPRGLDLGKEKYGGPFTTEQVEDVKAFYGILKVLFSFGVVFFLDYAASSVLPLFALHAAPYHNMMSYHNMTYDGPLIGKIVLNNGLLSPLLVAICIPLYLCLLRPFISRYVPGMLKRMGLGMVLVLISLLATFSMDTAVHRGDQRNSSYCMFKESGDIPHPTQSSAYLVFPLTLLALSDTLIDISVFEFICSQSPHSMKGLLIGVLYAIRGLYQLVAALFTLPFTFADTSHLSCGFYFYLVNIVIGLVAVLVYVWVAKRYRYRVRDELCNVHQYAEDYYSNPQRETFYDYSGEHN